MSQELNRKQAPLLQPMQQVEMIEPQIHTFENGSTLNNIVAGDQELIKLDLIFDAGLWQAQRPLLSSCTGMMLKEGTENYTSLEIAEAMDFYGSYLNVTPGYDNSVVSLLTLKKHLHKMLPILKEVVCKPIFPESDFDILKEKRKHRFIEESEKVGGLSQRRFMSEMFGNGHPYSPLMNIEQIDTIFRDDLIAFHKNNYKLNSMRIIACGQADQADIDLIEEYFGKEVSKNEESSLKETDFSMASPIEHIHIGKTDVVQNAICLGLELPNKTHADHHKIKMTNTILGGYFGSRLNANLREEKGYTYGIHSSIYSFLYGGLLMIYTEVGSDVSSLALEEIKKEMNRLCEELVPDEELDMVRNYNLGKILRDFDGPFARASSFEAVSEFNLNFDYYNSYIDTIKNITPEEIRETAQKYFSVDELLIVVAGQE